SGQRPRNRPPSGQRPRSQPRDQQALPPNRPPRNRLPQSQPRLQRPHPQPSQQQPASPRLRPRQPASPPSGGRGGRPRPTRLVPGPLPDAEPTPPLGEAQRAAPRRPPPHRHGSLARRRRDY